MPRLTPEQAAAGFTELHAAAHAGAASEVNALLEAGAVATALTAQSDSALHLAALGGHANVTRTLLAVAPSLLAETNAGGWTPLMLAVLSPAPPHHRTQCTALLLEAKADPWAATAQGWGALLLAAQRGDAATLGLVLARTQAAHGAGRLGELLQALQTAEGDGALHLAAHAGSAGCVRLLLAAGAPHAAARNTHGLSAAELAVHKACSDTSAAAAATGGDGYVAAVRLLAAAGSPLGPASLQRVAEAAAGVDEWRLLRLAVLMRRVGAEQAPARAGEVELKVEPGAGGGGAAGGSSGEGGGGEGSGGEGGDAAGQGTKEMDASAVADARGEGPRGCAGRHGDARGCTGLQGGCRERGCEGLQGGPLAALLLCPLRSPTPRAPRAPLRPHHTAHPTLQISIR